MKETTQETMHQAGTRAAKYRNAHAMLKALPDYFSISTLASVLGGGRQAATTYAKRWRDAGLIAAIGPHAGVFFNTAKRPDAVESCSLLAIRDMFPAAIIAGAASLHRFGWTTQIPDRTEIATLARPTFPALHEFEIMPRSAREMRILREHMHHKGMDVPILLPQYALADLWKHKECWHPDIDDLHLDDQEADWQKILDAFDECGVEWPNQYPRRCDIAQEPTSDSKPPVDEFDNAVKKTQHQRRA